MPDNTPPGLAAPAPAPAPVAPAPDAAMQQAAMKQLGTFIGQAVQQAVAPLHQEITTLKAKIAEPPKATPPPPAPALDEMVADPAAFARKIATEVYREQTRDGLGPYMVPALNAIREQAEAAQQARVDSRFGDGTWSELFAENYQKAVDSLPDASKYNPKALAAVVDGLIGSESLASPLEDRRQKAVRERQEQERMRPPSFLGTPGRQSLNTPAEITSEDREVQDSLKKAGFELPDDKIRLMRSIPKVADVDTQLEAYERATKKGAA